MHRIVGTLLLMTAAALPATAQHPLLRAADAVEVRADRGQPTLHYRLRVDATDTTGFEVTLAIGNAPADFLLAMPRHPEYDEKYWRQVEALRVASPAGTATITRSDSAAWRVHASGGAVTVTYRVTIRPPGDGLRAAWRPLLRSDGGMIGGPYGLLYVVGAELAPTRVQVQLPTGWSVATGLEPTSDPTEFFAPSATILMDSPFLIGQLRSWRFVEGGAPHRIAYLPAPRATPFDTLRLVRGIQQLSAQAIALFGRAPYREYTFLLQDEAYGALEHLNSVTLGAPSRELAADPTDALQEIAHEYFHAWNLMRIRPAGYPVLAWRPSPPSTGLWWSEGLTMFYADLLLRRAGIPLADSTRRDHLESLITRYLDEPGNSHFSAERVSQAEYSGRPDALGDYQASPHLQGELLGTMIDLAVRQATAGRRTIDDVMREVFHRFGGATGFTSTGLETAIAAVCGCSVKPLFDASIRGNAPIAFDHYLAMAGMRLQVSRTTAQGSDGRAVPDLRVYVWNREGEATARFLIRDPEGSWGRAGLHSGDLVQSVRGAAVPDWPAFRRLLVSLQVGDSVPVVVERGGSVIRTTVVIGPATETSVRITDLPQAGARAAARREEWLAGSQ